MFPETKIQTIHHAGQRYNTVGDYWTPFPSRLNIRVSALGDEEYEFLVAVHEFIESMLCRFRGIEDSEIDRFDKTWKAHDDLEEPGEDPIAPYHKEHMFAMSLERQIADELGVNWDHYSKVISDIIEEGEPAPVEPLDD